MSAAVWSSQTAEGAEQRWVGAADCGCCSHAHTASHLGQLRAHLLQQLLLLGVVGVHSTLKLSQALLVGGQVVHFLGLLRGSFD